MGALGPAARAVTRMKFRHAILCVALSAATAGIVSAQSFTLSPATPRQATATGLVTAAAVGGEPAGRDFAAEVIGDPWDFEQASDYNLMYSLHPSDPKRSAWAGVPTLNAGVFTGISATTTPKLSIQFEGIAGGFNMAGKNGVRYPIDASRYRRLSFRVRRSASPPDLMQVLWFNGITRSPATAGGRLWPSAGYNDQAGRYTNQMPASRQGSGWQIYKIDLDRPGGVWSHGVAWSGTMRGFEVMFGSDPSMVNATIEVDWVRLTQRGTAQVDLSFSGFGGPVTVTASHAETGDVIQVYPDNGTSATTFPDNSTYTWDYGFLPPGTWTITSSRGAVSRTQALVIDPAPIVHVTDPDVSGGRDFATSVIGDAWDMTNREDVYRHGRVYDMTAPTFGSSGLTATTLGPGGEAAGEGDAFVALVDDAIKYPNERVIPADQYHRLTFTLEYLTGKELPGPVALDNDWGAVYRVIWRQRAFGQAIGYSETLPIVMLDGGPQTFSMDLATLTKSGPVEPSVEPHSPALWTGDVGILRIDVNEARGVDRPFRLSNVKLAADDEPNGTGIFTVRWQTFDATYSRQVASANGTDAAVTLYYDTDGDPAGRTPIPGAANIPASNGQFAWNVAGLPAGTYWVFAQITDTAGNSHLRASTGPVRVRGGYISPTDNDNDGMPDAWESRYGISSPSADEDGDGVTNLQEYQQGTDPRLSNRWILPEGSTGYFTERLALANPNPEDAFVSISYLRENDPPVTRDYTVAAQSRLSIDVNSVPGLENGAVSAVVNTRAGGVLVERTMFWGDGRYGGHTGKAVPRAHTRWYLAEGHAGRFDTFVLLANANAQATTARVSFLLESGLPVQHTYVLQPNSRTTIHTNRIPELVGQAFSTTVESDLPITVERAMYFDSPGVPWDGGHAAAAVEAPATNWFVAEGYTAGTFDMFLLLANPGTQPTTATARYLRLDGTTVVETYELAPQSRTTVWVDYIPGLGATEVSAAISAPRPIVVERAMYWGAGSWTDGHASAGITSTGTKWGLAEGEHGGSRGFATFILLANPGSQTATVRVTVLRSAGLPTRTMDVQVAANSRFTIPSSQLGIGDGERFGAIIEALNNVPIVVERAMYWDGGGRWWGAGTNETAVKLK